MNHSKQIEPRFIAGPPGTGKTHKYITKLYEKLLSKYSYEKILILSHTNVAAEQILEAIIKLPQMNQITKKELRETIGTIHHYCKSRPSLLGK